MATQRTAADYAGNFQLFAEYIDPDMTTSRAEFDAMTMDERIELAQAVIDANSSGAADSDKNGE